MNLLKDTMLRQSLFYLLGQILVLLLAIGYLNFYYFERIVPDKKAAEEFNVTSCTVKNKQLMTLGDSGSHYRATFTLAYTVNGQTYQSLSSGNGVSMEFSSSDSGEQAVLDQFDIGTSYPCWYDPENPGKIVLVQAHGLSSTLPLLLPSLVILAILYYIARSVYNISVMILRKPFKK